MTAKFISNLNPPENDAGTEPHQGQPDPRPRILVVEDEQDLRQLTAEVLADAGYLVDVAADGAFAWSALQLRPYDLLITDQFMPKVSGVELLRKMHAARLSLPVIMATGYLPTWEFALHTWLQPAKMLLKPYSYEKLLAAVRNVLPQNSRVGAGLAMVALATGTTAVPIISPFFIRERPLVNARN